MGGRLQATSQTASSLLRLVIGASLAAAPGRRRAKPAHRRYWARAGHAGAKPTERRFRAGTALRQRTAHVSRLPRAARRRARRGLARLTPLAARSRWLSARGDAGPRNGGAGKEVQELHSLARAGGRVQLWAGAAARPGPRWPAIARAAGSDGRGLRSPRRGSSNQKWCRENFRHPRAAGRAGAGAIHPAAVRSPGDAAGSGAAGATGWAGAASGERG